MLVYLKPRNLENIYSAVRYRDVTCPMGHGRTRYHPIPSSPFSIRVIKLFDRKYT